MTATNRAIFVTLLSIFFIISSSDVHARTKPVYNIIDKPIQTGSGEVPTMEAVGNALANAARYKGWDVTDVEDGYKEAQIVVRQHFAAIDIRYTSETYSITYRDSKILKYDGTKIHRNYNKWIKLIEQLADQNFLAM